MSWFTADFLFFRYLLFIYFLTRAQTPCSAPHSYIRQKSSSLHLRLDLDPSTHTHFFISHKQPPSTLSI